MSRGLVPDALETMLAKAVAYAVQTQDMGEGRWEGTADPRIFDNAIVCLALSAFDPVLTRECLAWLRGAPSQTHDPLASAFEGWLRRLCLGSARPPSMPLELRDDVLGARAIMAGAVALHTGSPGASATGLLALTEGAWRRAGERRLKKWQRVCLAAADTIARRALGQLPSRDALGILQAAQDPDGSYARMPAVTALAFMALSAGWYEGSAQCLAYLRASRHTDGTWRFVANEIWDTALIVRSLRGCPGFDRHAMRAALAFLERSQDSAGGWGIRRGVESDLDTTAMALLALARTASGRRVWPSAAEFIRCWRQPNGSWMTWQSADDTPSQDVTAHALAAQRAYGTEPSVLTATEEWLAEQYAAIGWKADWYAPPSYAVAEIAAAADPAMLAGRAGVQNLLDLQMRDGGWPSHQGRADSGAAATGLALTALNPILAHRPEALRAALRGIDYLRERQQPDGTWAGTPIMYGPRPFLCHFPTHTHAFAAAGLRDLSKGMPRSLLSTTRQGSPS